MIAPPPLPGKRLGGPRFLFPLPGQSGYSLVELITVLVLLGILATVALPRFVGTGAFSGRAAGDRVVSAVRYAQEQAMSRNRHARIRFSGRTYRVQFRNASGSWETLPVPGTGEDEWTLPGDVRFSAAGNREFDGLGKPAPGDCGPGNTLGLTSGENIRIECRTGFAREV